MDKNCCYVKSWPTTPLCKFQKCLCEKCTKFQNNDNDGDPSIKDKEGNNHPPNRSHNRSKDRAGEEDSESRKSNSLTGNAGESSNYENNTNILSTILFDIIGAFAFFIMVTSVFWMTTAFYLKAMLLKLYHAERRTQMIVWCAIAVCSLGIAAHAYINLKHNRSTNEVHIPHPSPAQKSVSHRATMTSTSKGTITEPAEIKNGLSKPSGISNGSRNSKVCKFFFCKLISKFAMKTRPKNAEKRLQSDQCNTNLKSNNSNKQNYNNDNKPSNKLTSPPTCLQNSSDKTVSTQTDGKNVKMSALKNSANHQIKPEDEMSNQTPSMCDLLKDGNGCDSTSCCLSSSDDDGCKIYNSYRWYSIPLDMKTPPALLVYLKDYFTNSAN